MTKQLHYRLPDKTLTTDYDLFHKTWRDLAAPIERELGVRLRAFDPGLDFTDGKHWHFTVPVSVAMLIKRLGENQR